MKMRFINSNFLVVGIGAIVIAIFSLLFYYDFTKMVDSGEAEVVGHIIFMKNTPQRKYSTQVIWEDIKLNSPVYNNDTIRTPEQAEAVVHLKDGTEIILNENSMILLALSKNQIGIEFSRGSITTKRFSSRETEERDLNIKSGNTIISVGKGDLQISHDESMDLNLTVNRGKANISTGLYDKEIKEYQKIIVSNVTNDVKEYTYNLKLVSPSPDSYILATSESERINLSWKPFNRECLTVLEISDNSSFKKNCINKKITQNSITLLLKHGTYYWRLKSTDRVSKKIETSDSRKFTIIWNKPVQLISPKNMSVVSYRVTPPIIPFKWSNSKISSGYELLISDEPAMEKILFTYRIPENHLSIDSLINGTYYWRVVIVTGLRGLSRPGTSSIYKLKINKKKSTDPPKLLFPPENNAISRTLFKMNRVTFSWEKSREYNESQFFIATDHDFENIIYKTVSRTNFLKLEKDLPEGKYYWGVVGLINGEKSSLPSKRSFDVTGEEKIQLTLPADHTVIKPNEEESYPGIRFAWTKPGFDGKFCIQISRNKEFSPIYRKSIIQTSGTVIKDIEAGKYFWRVSALDFDETVLLNSEPQVIVIKKILPIPVAESPLNGTVINLKEANKLSLTWKKLEGANIYKIALYYISNKKKNKVFEKETKETSYNIDYIKKLNDGQFLWTLQAFTTDKGSHELVPKSKLGKSYFTVMRDEIMDKPKITDLKQPMDKPRITSMKKSMKKPKISKIKTNKDE